MDMRYKAYPELPAGRTLRLMLPRSGDLRYRSLLPTDFAQGFFVHADPRHRDWYLRFQVLRKFIVMSTQGDLYTKSLRVDFSMNDLPRRTLLAMPHVARGDLVKVLDFVQCASANGQRWELARVRWRNNMETWLSVEVVQLFAPHLLQEFYVNSINSWAFHNRVQPGNLALVRTEVELWLFHEGFQAFYVRLRQQRSARGTTATAQTQQQRQSSQQSQQTTQVRMKPEATSTITPAAATPTRNTNARTSFLEEPARQAYAPPLATTGGVSDATIRAFEQRRLAREQEEQRARVQRQVQELRAQQQAQLLAQRQRAAETEQRRHHEQQRQRVQQELQQKQLDYQRRLEAQKEQERRIEQQRQEKEKEEWIQSQRELRQRLQQEREHHQQPQEQTKRYQPQPAAQLKRHTRRLLCVDEPQQLQQQRRSSQQAGEVEQEPAKRQEDTTTSIWTKRVDDDYTPPESEEDESEESEASVDSSGNCESDGDDDVVQESMQTRRRRRKRLLYSQIEDDDDDDLPGLSEPATNTRQRTKEKERNKDKSVKRSKKHKRLSVSEALTDTANDLEPEVDPPQPSNSKEVDSEPQKAISSDEDEDKGKEGNNGADTPFNATSVDVEEEEEDEGADVSALAFMGEIRCICGATSVGKYCGKWLQCWKEDCGVWEHADCVGFLIKDAKGAKSKPLVNYVCSKCDPTAYLKRTAKASDRVLDWMFQCCDSHNSKQLLELLRDDCGADKLPSDWKTPNMEYRTLAMHMARRGLVKCLRYLLCERKVDIFATDKHSCNVLHHAALGNSLSCCRLLLKLEPKLLRHQDLHGCSPFHRMLQSPKVNKLCVPYLENEPALVGMGNLSSRLPIHFACEVINEFTVEICRLIFSAQPSMALEKSSDQYPVMILCQASGRPSPKQTKAGYVDDLSKVAQWTKQIVTMILDIDLFGECLNYRSSNGWMALHHAVFAGNHELVGYLCNLKLFDIHAAVKKTNETALHIAARCNHPLCVRTLLDHGLDVVAKDEKERIPMLCAKDVECVQEFLHYKLTKQLSRLHRMINKFQEKEIVRHWQRTVVLDPTCFDILNDWCQQSTERIERMEGLLLTNPFMLRLDNKIDYIVSYVIPSLKAVADHKNPNSQHNEGSSNSNKDKNGDSTANSTTSATIKKKVGFTFSRENGTYWKQFISMARGLEPEDFRSPFAFATAHDAEPRPAKLTVVLIHLAADLRKEEHGLLLGSAGVQSEGQQLPSINENTPLEGKLLNFYVLGELVAHFVLFAVSVSGILDFAPAFLRCVTCEGKYRLAADEPWAAVGRCFAAGFKAVVPATLELLRADDFRVLLNGSEAALNALQIDWDTAVNWPDQPPKDTATTVTEGEEQAEGAKVWMPRLMRELVVEEQQLLLLFLTGTFQSATKRLFRADENSERLTIATCAASDAVADYDAMLPVMEHTSGTLHLPPYSCFEAFKKAMLTAIRQADRAFLPN